MAAAQRHERDHMIHHQPRKDQNSKYRFYRSRFSFTPSKVKKKKKPQGEPLQVRDRLQCLCSSKLLAPSGASELKHEDTPWAGKGRRCRTSRSSIAWACRKAARRPQTPSQPRDQRLRGLLGLQVGANGDKCERRIEAEGAESRRRQRVGRWVTEGDRKGDRQEEVTD